MNDDSLKHTMIGEFDERLTEIDTSIRALSSSKSCPSACADRFSSGGIYQLFIAGIFNSQTKDETRFDYRVFSRRLSADDLERVYQNGKTEAYLRNLF